MMFVFAIIAILSMMAVGGYSQYRRSALIDVAADSFISQVNELKSDILYGQLNKNDDGLVCRGFLIEDNTLKSYSQKFTGKKIWDEYNNKWIYSGCVNFEERKVFDFAFDKDVSLVAVDDDVLNGFVLRFIPPEAKIEVSFDGGLSFNTSNYADYSFSMKYGEGENYMRTFKIDLSTAQISK